METKIVLSVAGVDLSDTAQLRVLSERLADIGWVDTGGLVQAVVYTESTSPVGVAFDVALRIRATFPGVASVPRADPELVSASDVANRLSVSPETVRTWATGKRRWSAPRFPLPRARVNSSGRTPISVWAWRDVVEWLRIASKLDPEPGVLFLTDRELAQLDQLLANRARSARDWMPIGYATDVILGQVDAALSAERDAVATKRFVANG